MASIKSPNRSAVDEGPVARRPLAVAVVTETWPPEVNGVSLTLARIVDGLKARGHGVQLIRPRQPAVDAPGPSRPDELLLRGCPIPNYPHLRMGLPGRGALSRRWQQCRPDVVHVATEGPLGWSALRAAAALRLPLSSDFRTNFHAYSRHYGAGWLARPILGWLRRFHNRADATMVPTAALRDELGAAGFQRLHVVGRGVDHELFSPARRSAALRASWGVADGAPVAICVGRLAPEKNLELALQAFAAIRRMRPHARLLFVGDGPLRLTLQARCEGAIFAGTRRGEDLAAHYASADLLLFPSLTETFGNVTTEALASGLPLVAFDRAAAAQLVRSGDNGLLAPADDECQFVDHAVRAAVNPHFARRLGQRARETALAHGWDAVVAEVESVLRGAIQRATPVEAAQPAWRTSAA